MMIFYDGAANRQSDSHAVILGCVECIEESVRSLRVETDPRILHGQAHTIVFVRSVLMTNSLGRSSTRVIASEAFRSRLMMTC